MTADILAGGARTVSDAMHSSQAERRGGEEQVRFALAPSSAGSFGALVQRKQPPPHHREVRQSLCLCIACDGCG
jgi:hypothetical protein